MLHFTIGTVLESVLINNKKLTNKELEDGFATYRGFGFSEGDWYLYDDYRTCSHASHCGL